MRIFVHSAALQILNHYMPDRELVKRIRCPLGEPEGKGKGEEKEKTKEKRKRGKERQGDKKDRKHTKRVQLCLLSKL